MHGALTAGARIEGVVVFGPWIIGHGLDRTERCVAFSIRDDRPYESIRVAPYRTLAPNIMHRIGLTFCELFVYRVQCGQQVFLAPTHIATEFFGCGVL